MSTADFSALAAVGLNLHAVLDIDALPAELRTPLRADFDPAGRCRQLILIGHAGTALWAEVQRAGAGGADPIDDFSVAAVQRWFGAHGGGRHHVFVYPGNCRIGLQALGSVAGWHHPTPFKVGIMQPWGSWFGYRAVLLADTMFTPTPPRPQESPCASCATRVCVAACPAPAMDSGDFDLAACLAYRVEADSRCRATCVARLACPVGAQHRYDDAQLRHSYVQSLAAIARR